MGTIAIVNFVSGSKGQSRSGMKAVMRYAAQDKKTLWQGQQLVSGVNCQATSVYDDFEPFPKKRTQKVKKKRNDSWCIRTGGQAAEQRRPASKRAGEIQPRAE